MYTHMLGSRYTYGLITDSFEYNILRRNRALNEHLRATGMIQDVVGLIIEYTQPASDIMNRIARIDMTISDPVHIGTDDDYLSQLTIRYVDLQWDNQCESCFTRHSHICAFWELYDVSYGFTENAAHFLNESINFDDIFLLLYTGDVRSLVPALVNDNYVWDSEFDKSLSDEQCKTLDDIRVNIVLSAAQKLIDGLIW